MKDCPMPRFTSNSSRRLVAALAVATTTVVPALAIIAGQPPTSALGLLLSPFGSKMR
jgi:hypothetical protein